MNTISTGEILTIIAAAAAAVVSIVNAIAGGWGRAKLQQSASSLQQSAQSADQKLDHIKELTNSSMEALKRKLADALAVQEQLYDKLAIALARIDRLETLLSVKLGLDTELPKDPA